MTNIILLAVDLDYTHFNSSKPKITWIGSKQFWLDLYSNVIKEAAKHGIEIQFAIVTRKDRFDDLCEEAARAFGHFFSNAKVPMMVEQNNTSYCLARYPDNQLRYRHLQQPFDQCAASSTVRFSHFNVINTIMKSEVILELASSYGIPATQCIIVDDTPWVLDECEAAGIHPISAACFNNSINDLNLLDSQIYVRQNLNEIKVNLENKVAELIEMMTAVNREDPVSEEVYEESMLVEDSAPYTHDYLLSLFQAFTVFSDGPEIPFSRPVAYQFSKSRENTYLDAMEQSSVEISDAYKCCTLQ